MSQMQAPDAVPEFDQADRLGKALQYAGVSVQEMADVLEVSRNTVGNYLNRRTTITRPAMIMWSLRTGVNLKWLETGSPGHDPGDGWAPWDSNPQPADYAFRGRREGSRRRPQAFAARRCGMPNAA